jgi:hypothetical protein
VANVTYTAVDGVTLEGNEELATLINDTAESITAGALVTDGTFPNGDNWTLGAGWTVPAATGWNLASATYTGKSFDLTSYLPVGNAGTVILNAAQDKMYVLARSTSQYMYQFILSTPGDISTAGTPTGPYVIGAGSADYPSSVRWKADGLAMFVSVQTATAGCTKISVATAFDLTSARATVGTLTPSGYGVNPMSQWMDSTGTHVFILMLSTQLVIHYTLSTPFDVTTGTYIDQLSVGGTDSDPWGIELKPDGTKLYITGNTNNKVYQYSMPTPFSFTGASKDAAELDISSQVTDVKSIYIEPVLGFDAYIVDQSTRYVYQYLLTSL